MATNLVDVHAHFVTDAYVRQAIAAGHDRPDGLAGALLGMVDPGRLRFGSDHCWTTPPVTDAHIAAIDAAEPTRP